MNDPSTRRGKGWSLAGLVLLCSHCAIGGLVAGLAALGVLSAPTWLGIDWNWVWPPFFILGGFALYLWSGRERACDVPE